MQIYTHITVTMTPEISRNIDNFSFQHNYQPRKESHQIQRRSMRSKEANFSSHFSSGLENILLHTHREKITKLMFDLPVSYTVS